MDYLVYISHDAENLQFWLWLQDYTNRFNAAPRSEQVLSPPWSQEEAPQPTGNSEPFKTDFEVSFEAETPPLPPKPESQSYFFTPIARSESLPRIQTDDKQLPTWQPESPIVSSALDRQSFVSSNVGTKQSVVDSVEEANDIMGFLQWQPCKYRPTVVKSMVH